MNRLSKNEIGAMIYALEERMRNGPLEESELKNVVSAHSTLKVMYTAFVRAESHELKKTFCPLCGGTLVLVPEDPGSGGQETRDQGAP